MSDLSKRHEKERDLGWSPKTAAGFAPWLQDPTWWPLKRFRQWRRYPVPEPYTPRKQDVGETGSTYGDLQSQICEQRLYEHSAAGGAVSGFIIYELRGTERFAKELSLWLQGDEKNHDRDVERFLSMADRLSKRATGYVLPDPTRNRVLDRNSRSQEWSGGDIHIGTAGHGYRFANYNAASSRETWARQYLLKIIAPDRTRVLVERRAQSANSGRVYAGSDPEAWGLKTS
ncbi:hypothetical protein [Labrenzia sp. VG12]|uniref:hypothetical protein n=1 Tax=Labrenzia sp. VG12 TaxID=2021862 RepID=UPI0012FDEEBB|nr:hypothetical protein [Labrenzia sp. VG12]